MSKPDTWMPLFVADYTADTKRLTLQEHGAYLLLLMDYWRNGAPPDDDATLARILGVERRIWCKIRAGIAPFFVIEDDRWTHKRVERELAGAVERSGKAAAKAKLAASTRWDAERRRKEGAGGDAPGNAPSISRVMPDHMLQAVLEQCPPPVTYSEPAAQAPSAPQDPNKEAWEQGVNVLMSQGRLTDGKARKFFGKLLKDHYGLKPSDLLEAIKNAKKIATQDPQSYLVRAASGVAGPDVTTWSQETWAIALEAFAADPQRWDDRMGPRPGQSGCLAPAAILAQHGHLADVIPLRSASA